LSQFVLGSNYIVKTKYNKLAYLSLLTAIIKIESRLLNNSEQFV